MPETDARPYTTLGSPEGSAPIEIGPQPATQEVSKLRHFFAFVVGGVAVWGFRASPDACLEAQRVADETLVGMGRFCCRVGRAVTRRP